MTGHRWREAHHASDERLDPSRADAVRDAIRLVLQRMRATALDVQRDHTTLFDTGTPRCSLLSALAEGADELAASVAVEAESGYTLDVVVPYDFATYSPRCAPGTPLRTLWDGARARLILDGVPLADQPRDGETHARDESALVETNRRLVWNSDIVIAVWDGRHARGEAGTARVIERARLEGLPIVHIHSADPSRIVMLDAEGGAQSTGVDPLTAIDSVIRRLLTPPVDLRHIAGGAHPRPNGSHGANHKGESDREALAEYMAETPPSWIVRSVAARIYKAVLWALTGFDRDASLRGLAADPSSVPIPWSSTAAAFGFDAARSARLNAAFQRADYYATAYGARHRSTFTTILFLAPLAVVCAWIGSLANEHDRPWWAATELILLLVLLLFYANSRRLRFHAKWLDYRLLAERLRHLGFLWPLGRTSPVVRVPIHAAPKDPRPSWANWLYRATARELGLASITYTPDSLRDAAAEIRTAFIQDQAAYNRTAHRLAHHAEHRLHLMPWIPLGLAVIAAALHVVEHAFHLKLPHVIAASLTPIGILGPAFGAALHGFASQAGFTDIGIRTDASAQQLEHFADECAGIDLAAPLASAALGELALDVADVMGGDLAGWRVDYLARPINPPG